MAGRPPARGLRPLPRVLARETGCRRHPVAGSPKAASSRGSPCRDSRLPPLRAAPGLRRPPRTPKSRVGPGPGGSAVMLPSGQAGSRIIQPSGRSGVSGPPPEGPGHVSARLALQNSAPAASGKAHPSSGSRSWSRNCDRQEAEPEWDPPSGRTPSPAPGGGWKDAGAPGHPQAQWGLPDPLREDPAGGTWRERERPPLPAIRGGHSGNSGPFPWAALS